MLEYFCVWSCKCLSLKWKLLLQQHTIKQKLWCIIDYKLLQIIPVSTFGYWRGISYTCYLQLCIHTALLHVFQYPLPWASCPELPNGTKVPECELSSETAYFWYRTTLDVSPSMNETGGLKWWIVLCLLLAWTIVFFIVMKGIQSSGKVRMLN